MTAGEDEEGEEGGNEGEEEEEEGAYGRNMARDVADEEMYSL